MAQRGENVAEFAFLFGGIRHAIGREDGKLQSMGYFDGDTVAGFFFAVKMPLQFDVNILASEDFDQAKNRSKCFPRTAARERRGKRAIICTCKADKSRGVLFQLIFKNCTFFFRGAQFHFCDQATKVLIASAVLDEEREAKIPAGARSIV